MHTCRLHGYNQGGIISPLNWPLVINLILLELETKGLAYVDDVVILITGMFLCVLCEIMDYGVWINPSKTQLVLYTERTNLQLPSRDIN